MRRAFRRSRTSTAYARMGIDLFCFSGGKGLRGPQCSGILLGRKDLIEAALAQCSPWEGAVCRAMKVGKEEIVGVLAAVEAWTRLDLAALNKQWSRRVERIAKLVETVPGVTTNITIPEGGNSYPTLTVSWDQEAFGFTVADCDRELRAGDPRIEVLTSSNPSFVPAAHEGMQAGRKPTERRPDRLQIISMTMKDGEELIVGRRLRDILNAREQEGEGMRPLTLLRGSAVRRHASARSPSRCAGERAGARGAVQPWRHRRRLPLRLRSGREDGGWPDARNVRGAGAADAGQRQSGRRGRRPDARPRRLHACLPGRHQQRRRARPRLRALLSKGSAGARDDWRRTPARHAG